MKKIITIMALCLLGACSSSSDSTTSDSNLTIFGAGAAEDSETSITVRSEAITRDGEPVGSPLSATVTAYAFYVSANTDCSDPILVGGDGETAVEHDLINNPTLFEATVDEGSYPCMIMVISDNLVFVPDEDAVAAWPDFCNADTEEVFDIYREDSGEEEPWVDVDGNDIVATGTETEPGSDTVAIFATTDPDAVVATGANANQVGELTSALVVPGEATFYFDATNGILGDTRCAIEEATIGFR